MSKAVGRPKGSLNKKTQAIIEGAAAGGMMPLDYMLSVMRDNEAEAHRRDDMAKAAAPYLHARVGGEGVNMNLRGLNGGSTQLRAEIYGIRVEFVKSPHVDE